MNRCGCKQQGLTLIELMISIVIGLLISIMAVQYLVSSVRLFRQGEVDTKLESNGTFAISYLSQYLRQAGTTRDVGKEVPFYIEDCGGFDPCTDNSDVSGISDRFGVLMFPRNGADCVGNPVDADTDLVNVFYIADQSDSPSNSCGTTTECSLYCRGYDAFAETWLGNSEALIDGVDQMQVLYGLTDNNGQVTQYVDASRVAPAGASIADAYQAWAQVRTVKLALLISDIENSGTEQEETRNFQLLDSPQVTLTDRVSRRVYSTTVTINNNLQ